MKITFIQPYYENVWESLGLGYIIAYAKKCLKEVGFAVDINFFQGKFDCDQVILEGCRGSDIVAFSCTSPAYEHGLKLAGILKQNNPEVHIVFGGWHPTALPDDVIAEDCVDQVIVGEGEIAMARVILGSRNPILKGSKLEADDLPRPDRHTIKNKRTIDLCEKMNGHRTASFQMNRGCKANCKFCAESVMTGKHNGKTNPIRTRHYDDVLNEIRVVEAEFGINHFKFVDATFDRDPQMVIDFCKRKFERSNTMRWEANIHPNFVQAEEVFKWLYLSGCEQINVGVESGSPYILKDIGKGTTISGIKKVFEWAKKYDIKTRAFFLLGMPDEDDGDLDMTIDLIDEIQPDVVGFTILAPYPGSDYYYPEHHKHVDWSKVDEYSNDIWWTNTFSNNQLKDNQAMFKEKYKHLLCERQA